MPIKAVLFDMFDTLFIIEKNHEFHQPALTRMYLYLKSKGVNTDFEKFQTTYFETRDKLLTEADLNLEDPHFNFRIAETLKVLGYKYDTFDPIVSGATNEFAEEFMKYVCIDAEAKEVLNVLSKNFVLGIISNFAIPECVQKLLKINCVDELFDVVIISGTINKRKPSEEIFLKALKTLDISAEETVFVGDTIDADVDGAKSVGMKAVYIERRAQKFLKYFPDHTIKSLKELVHTIAHY